MKTHVLWICAPKILHLKHQFRSESIIHFFGVDRDSKALVWVNILHLIMIAVTRTKLSKLLVALRRVADVALP